MLNHRWSDELADATVDELLTGRRDADEASLGDLAALVAELRTVETEPAPPVRAELAVLFATGRLPDGPFPVAAAPFTEPQSRRRRMLTALGTFLASVTGKVVLGAAAATASVGAAHAVGVVDLPGLPDQAEVVEVPAVEVGDGARPGGGLVGEPGGQGGAGVDGSEISDRATSGEPQEDGQEFGRSVAEEATSGTPAEGRPGSAGADARPETPGSGADEVADEHRHDTTPAGGPSTAEDRTPSDTPSPGSDAEGDKKPDGTATDGRP